MKQEIDIVTDLIKVSIFKKLMLFSGNSANAFSSDLNSICRNEVQTNRFEDVKSRGKVEITW